MGGVKSKVKSLPWKKDKSTDVEELRPGPKNAARQPERVEENPSSLDVSVCDRIDEISRGDLSKAVRFPGHSGQLSPFTANRVINVVHIDDDQSDRQSEYLSSKVDPPTIAETHTQLPMITNSRTFLVQNNDEDNRSECPTPRYTSKHEDVQGEERPSSAPPERFDFSKKRKRRKTVHPESGDLKKAPTPPPQLKSFLPEPSGNEWPRDPRLQLGSIHESDDDIQISLSKTEWVEKVRRKDTEIEDLQNKLRKLSEDNENLRLRLSAAAGTKLTTNNPNITDLSDGNRPGKLAERFSELYDNEWTDAYAILEELYTDVGLKSDKRVKQVKEITQILLQLLHKIYTTCHNEAKSNIDSLWNAYTNVCGVSDANLEIRKHIMTERKSNYKATLPTVSRGVTKAISAYVQSHWKLKESPDILSRLQPYTDTCIEVCWLMVIQDPPVHMCCDKMKKKTPFDKDLYKEYTISGRHVAFLVWPVLYLYDGGPILNKGVAQGTGNKTSNRSHQSTGIGSVQNDNVADEIETLSE